MKKGIAFAAAIGLPALAIAGPEAAPIEAPAANSGDWCTWYGNKPGIVYKDKENPYIQEVQFEGRFQFQTAYIDGEDVAGNDFNHKYNEVRRVRLGVKSKFLQYFGMKLQANLVGDRRNSNPGGDLDWGYDDIDEAYLSFDLNKAIGDTGLDELSVIYGRQKFDFGTEAHESSNKILTIERSALSNRVYGSFRPTGVTVEGAKDDFFFATSVYSSSEDGADNEGLSGWNDSYSLLFNVGYQLNEKLLLRSDLTYNNAEVTKPEDSIMNYEWAVGIGAEYVDTKWGINGDMIYGDNGGAGYQSNAARRGNFFGMQVTPWMWLIDEKLQLVGQYQYQGSDESQGVRINSRYGRADGINNVNGGRGDSHNSFYGGLNYYLCGQSVKFQGGIEYQVMDTATSDFSEFTYLLAFRTFF